MERLAGSESDIDFLIELERSAAFLTAPLWSWIWRNFWGGGWTSANERGLKPRIREQILREAVSL